MAKRTMSKEDNVSAIRDDYENLKNDVAALSNTLIQEGYSKAGEARKWFREGVDIAKKKAKTNYSLLNKKVKENPAESVGIAFATGFLLSQIFKRR